MEKIKDSLPIPLPYSFEPQYKIEDILFFDIETTGLSADVSSLYLIGCLYYKEGSFQLLQLFADDYKSEKMLLIEFFEVLKSYKLLIHYNGTGFDIPYLLKKCAQHGLSCQFDSVESLDIYKEIGFLKSILKLPNLKQKSIEEFLGCRRKNLLSGKDLIQVYSEYMQKKLLSKPYEMARYALLLHNHDDLEGLLYSTAMLSFRDIFNPPFENTEWRLTKEALSVTCTLKNPLPAQFHYDEPPLSLKASKNQVFLTIQTFQGTAKHFYKNYKDYYYLPKEDTSIHKSVADYVDKEFKEKAKAKNCYTKKEGVFLPQYTELITPCFQEDYKSLPYYFEADSKILEQTELLMLYQSHILEKLAKLIRGRKKP